MTETDLKRRITKSREAMARHRPGTAPHTKARNTERRLRKELAAFRAGDYPNWMDYDPAEI